MTDAVGKWLSAEELHENVRVNLLAWVADWLKTDYSMMSSVHTAVHGGMTPAAIRAALADTAVVGEIERLLTIPRSLQQIEAVLVKAGIRMYSDADEDVLWLDVVSLPLRGVTVSHCIGGDDSSQPPDAEFMRQVAEVAVPALYQAGYRLARLEGFRVTPLDRERALAEFAISTECFGILDDQHFVEGRK